MAFMISRETENVKSSEEIESAFRALSSEGKPYVTKEELYQVRLGKGKISWAQLMLKGTPHIHRLRSWQNWPGATPYLWVLEVSTG